MALILGLIFLRNIDVPANVPPVPVAKTIASTVPPVCFHISGPVVSI